MAIEHNVKRCLIYTGFLKNELFCIEDTKEFKAREAQRFRSDIYRLQKNCDAVFKVPKARQEEVEDIVLKYQELFIGIIEADEEKIKRITDILEEK